MTEPQQDALIALLRQNGVKTVRTGIGGKFNHFITGAYRVGIGTLANVSPTAASKARWQRS
jgi:thiamine pyrophosphate-dependent acetolactate synthase large subunit-like protein